MSRRMETTCVAVAAAVLVSLFSATALAADDVRRPELFSVAVGRNATSPGGALTVMADAWDADGIESILLRFQNAATGELVTVSLREAPDDADFEERYSGTLIIPASAAEGVYTLKSAVLFDKRENRSLYYREEEMKWDADDAFVLEEMTGFERMPAFAVLSAEGAPALLSCREGSQILSPGGSTALTLDIADSGAGFDRGSLFFQNPASGRKLYFPLDAEDLSEGDTLVTTLTIPENEAAGCYQLYKATLQDTTGNKRVYCNDGDEDSQPLTLFCEFTVVTSPSGDSIPPRLFSVAVPTVRTSGNNLQYFVEVRAVDDLSGIKNITMRFQNDQNGRAVSKLLSADSAADGLFSGWMDVSLFEPEGAFQLDNVSLTDAAGNYQAYCRPADVTQSNHKLALPAPVSFMVKTGILRADETAPVLESVCISPERADIGTSIEVQATADDDLSGVDEIKVKFQNGAGKSINVTLMEKNGLFIGMIKDFQTKTEGTYRLVRVKLTDKAGNRRTCYTVPGSIGEALTVTAAFTLEDR